MQQQSSSSAHSKQQQQPQDPACREGQLCGKRPLDCWAAAATHAIQARRLQDARPGDAGICRRPRPHRARRLLRRLARSERRLAVRQLAAPPRHPNARRGPRSPPAGEGKAGLFRAVQEVRRQRQGEGWLCEEQRQFAGGRLWWCAVSFWGGGRLWWCAVLGGSACGGVGRCCCQRLLALDERPSCLSAQHPSSHSSSVVGWHSLCAVSARRRMSHIIIIITLPSMSHNAAIDVAQEVL